MAQRRLAVIGAGVVGSSIAYHAARAGWHVALFDRGFSLRGTSGSTQAWVWVQSKRPDHYAELSYLSRELYPQLEDRIGSIEFSPTGGLDPVFTERECTEAHALIKAQRALGLTLEWLDSEQVRRIEPALSPGVLGAIFSPHDANVNPMALVRALLQGLRRLGGVLYFQTPVRSIEPHSTGWQVTGNLGTLWEGEQVVLAAGNDTPELLAPLGIPFPVRAVRGQILVTEPMAPLIHHTLSAMRQMHNGEILIGYSHEEHQTRRDVTLPYLSAASALAIKWVPSLQSVPIVRSFAGLRVMPQDGLPILGPIPNWPGLSVAAMHSGYTLAPVVGHLAVEWLEEKASSIDLTPYRLERFNLQEKG